MAASDRIPGRRAYGGVLIVEALIDRFRAELIVDTGAAVTALTPRAVERMLLDRSRFSGRRRVFTAAGIYVTVPTGRVDRFRLGGVELRNVEVAILDLPANLNVEGVLGINVLERFRVTFEFRRATLVLRPEAVR